MRTNPSICAPPVTAARAPASFVPDPEPCRRAWSDLVDQKNLTALRTRLSRCGVSIFNGRPGLPSDPNRGCTEEGTSIALDALYRQSVVVLVDLVCDAVPSPLRRGNRRGSRSKKRVKHSISNETEHAHEPLCELQRKRRRVLP